MYIYVVPATQDTEMDFLKKSENSLGAIAITRVHSEW